jgi:GGDEF domain-containing protein
VTGVVNAASLLDRLRTERADEQNRAAPIVLVFYRVDGLDEFGELSMVEEAMRRVAGAILQATKGKTLLARAADGEFVALSRTAVHEVHAMSEEACRRIERQAAKRRSATPPFVLTAAVVPVAPMAPSGADTVLQHAREVAFLALSEVSAGVVTTAPLGAQEGE